MLYRVIERFIDSQDEGHLYEEGDLYPRLGYKPNKKRDEELSSTDNKRNIRAIEHIDLSKEKISDLKKIAEKRNVEGYDSMKKAELIEALEGAE